MRFVVLLVLAVVLGMCGESRVLASGELETLVAEGGPATETERREIARWQRACPHSRGADDPVEALLGLVRLEKVLGVDSWRPGLLGAVWCVESAWSVKGRVWGDHRGGVPMAWGPFQLWLSSRRWCSLTDEGAHDLATSARCWVAQVLHLEAKARRLCPRTKDPLRVAEAALSNVRKYQWNCRLSSNHWKIARRGLTQ